VINLLLKYIVDVNAQDNNGCNLLSWLCRRMYYSGDEAEHQYINEMSSILLNHGAKIDLVGEEGWCDLHTVCRSGNVLLLQLFLDSHVVEINGRDPSGHTMLSKLCEKYLEYKNHKLRGGIDFIPRIFYPMLTCLIRRGAKPSFGHTMSSLDHSYSNSPSTVFHIIGHRKQYFKSILKLFLDNGANLNCQDGNGNTILHAVLLEVLPNHNDQIVQFLIDDCHADYQNIKNKNQQTAWDIGVNELNKIRSSRKKRYHYRMKLYSIMAQKRRQHMYSDILQLMLTSMN
jgi:ankyrin repeat protein